MSVRVEYQGDMIKDKTSNPGSFTIHAGSTVSGTILKEVKEVQIENPAAGANTGKLDEQARDMDEDHFSNLWKAYYHSISITERANPRQMACMMPRRYWKFLFLSSCSFAVKKHNNHRKYAVIISYIYRIMVLDDGKIHIRA